MALPSGCSATAAKYLGMEGCGGGREDGERAFLTSQSSNTITVRNMAIL